MKKNTPYKTIYKQPLTKGEKLKILGTIVFWIIFTFFVIGLFIVNWSRIRTTMQNALWPTWFKSRSPQSTPGPISPLPDPLDEFEILSLGQPPEPELRQPQRIEPLGPPPAPVQSPPPPLSPEPPPVVEPVVSSAPAQSPPPGIPRDRSLYFIQIDRNGAILRSKVTRAVPVSDSPLVDVLEMLLKGPTEEEKHRGLISLIPEGTQILSARVLHDTAYISISEDFQYNTFGVEGYAAQLTQLIWTATEFTNVKTVQVLIDGRRIDYLGEGIWIGSPISREAF